jgi:hypothetical protein
MTPQTKGNILGILFVAAIAAIGVYIVLAGLGKFGRSTGDAPGWVLVVAGAAFLLAAGSMGLSAVGGIFFGAKAGADGSLSGEAPRAIRTAQIFLSLGIVAMLATVATWVALNPEGDASTGRKFAFAAGAVMTWSILIGCGIWRLRGLRR